MSFLEVVLYKFSFMLNFETTQENDFTHKQILDKIVRESNFDYFYNFLHFVTEYLSSMGTSA